ncbi:MAG TPA: tetratricopeptide repeat protein, partial [Kofleriaceae bacterium]|nr:tetratricopeptide repeat protein [Kofleriaceae bacterium]
MVQGLIVVFAALTLTGQGERAGPASAQHLLPGARIEGEAMVGTTVSHVFYARAGHYVHVTIESQGVPLVAAVLDPAGAIIAEARDPDGGDAPLRLSMIAERSGVHELQLVVPGKGRRSGHYRLTLDRPRAARDDDRVRMQAVKAYADGARLAAAQTAETTREAMKRYGAAREAWHRIGDAREEADAWTAIGELQIGQGSTREALAAAEAALALYRTAGDRRGEANSLNGLGVTTWSLGDSRAALVYYQRALPIAHELGLPSVEGRILSNVGSAYKNLGDARTALAFYERSLPLRREGGDLAGEATSLSNIGVAYRMLGDRGRARSAYEEALPLARAAGDTAAEGVALQNLGALSLGAGDLERGEEVLGTALVLSRRTGDRRGEAFILGWLSHAQRLRGDLAKAIELSNQDLTIQRAIADRHGEGATLTYLGTLHRLRRETAAADENLAAALRVQHEIGDRSGETYSLLELAGLRQDTGDVAAATRVFAQALAASRSIDDPGAEATALFHGAQLRRAQGDLPAARDAVGSAIALLEAARARVEGSRLRAAFFTSAQDAYELLIDLLMTMDTARPRRGLDRQALEASERKRARTLIDLLTSAGVESPAPAPNAAADTLDAHRLLDDRTVVVELSLGERASYAWAITRSGIHAARLAPRAEIAAAARAFYELLATPPPREAADADRRTRRLEAAGAQLTRLVLEPLADHLDRERIAIVADGALQYVPFAALPAPRPKRARGGSDGAAPPLVADHEVVLLPSITALGRLRERAPTHKAARTTVAVLADPVFEADDPRVDRRGAATDAAGP